MRSIAAPALETARRPVVAAAVAVAATGFVAAGLTGWVVAESPVVRDPASTSVLRALLVAAYVAVGTYLWLSRPQSRLGLLVTGTGFLFALVTLDAYRGSLPYTLGRLALVATVVYLIYVFLCFPGDRLGSELERRLIVAIVVAQTLVWALALAVTKNLPKGGALTDCRNPCPTNAFQLVSAPGVARTAVFLVQALTLVEVAVLLFLLVGKYRSPALRGFKIPVRWAASARSRWFRRGLDGSRARARISDRVGPRNSLTEVRDRRSCSSCAL